MSPEVGSFVFAEERHALITALLADRGRITVPELAERFGITPETVRRDLDSLEKARLLRRVHGGAVASDRVSMSESSLDERQGKHSDKKSRIAQAALAMLPRTKAVSVVLDSGTTTERLADLLVDWEPTSPSDQLLVITNAIPIAYKLSAHPDMQVTITGGHIRGLTRAIVGDSTREQFEALRPDIAFIGTNGVHETFGLSTPDPVEAITKSSMVRSARRVVVLVDSSKLGKEALVRFASLHEVDTIVTDEAPTGELASAIAAAGVEVVVA